MYLTTEELQRYNNDGFLVLPSLFSQTEVEIIKAELPSIFAEDTPRRVLEKKGNVVRSVYGSHTVNEVARRLSQHSRIVEPAMQMLEGDVYVYQFKINAKAGFGGDIWEWHQDYIFWRNEDGMSDSRVTTAAIFLDEVTEFNGPLILIPGSHKEGVIDISARNGVPSGYQDSPTWISNLTASLKYSLSKNEISYLAKKYSLVAPKGPAGSVLFFHGNMVHGSAANTSPFDRVVALVTFSSTANVLLPVEHPRPEFLASRNPEPIEPLADDILLS